MTAATIPQAAFGVTISWDGHDLGYLLDVSYSGLSAETVDLSSMKSAYKVFVAGMLDGGEVTIPVRLITGDSSGQHHVLEDMKTRTGREVIITLPDATTWTFDAIATKFGDFTYGMNGAVDAVIVLKVTAEPQFSEED
uniref:Tail protein n=1 Tax=viral metagenome TaxID=1070528 RepID=A0A6M3JWV6_9ZZZZ